MLYHMIMYYLIVDLCNKQSHIEYTCYMDTVSSSFVIIGEELGISEISM